jgi:hypothetical protein
MSDQVSSSKVESMCNSCFRAIVNMERFVVIRPPSQPLSLFPEKIDAAERKLLRRCYVRFRKE